MPQENKQALEDRFLALRYMEYDFVIPLMDVDHIAAEPPEDAMPFGAANTGAKTSYVVAKAGDAKLVIAADEIYGLVYLPPELQFELPEEAKGPDNGWIFGVASLEEEQRLAFLLDCSRMLTKREGEDEA